MPTSETQLHRDVTCLGCGCLCDDLYVMVEAGEIPTAETACERGKNWLQICSQQAKQDASAPPALVEGRSVSLETAIDEAVMRLRASRSALIVPAGISTEAASALVGLADRLRATIEPTGADPHKLAALQRFGEVSATLGEIRDRAECVVVWGADLDRDYPRFRERFLPGRTVLEVPVDQAQSHAAEQFAALRGLVADHPVDLNRFERNTKIPAQRLLDLADALKRSKSGALLHGKELERADPYAAGELARLVIDLNARGRFWTVRLGGSDNAGGVASALTWTSGAPSGIDYSLGHPRHLPGVGKERFARGEIDMIVHVSGDGVVKPSLQHDWPTIAVGPVATSEMGAIVAIATQRLGFEESGTVSRMDGLLLPVASLVPSERPTVLSVIQEIIARWDEEASG